MNKTSFTMAVVTIVALARTGSAQIWDRMTTPQIPVTIHHAAAIKVPLDHVVFAQADGTCADTLTGVLMADMAAGGATVLDREHLAALDAEHKTTHALTFDQTTVARMGKLIGTGTLMFVKVHECKVTHSSRTQEWKDKDGTTHQTTIPKTHGVLRALIQATDLSTRATIAHAVDTTIDLPKSEDSQAGFGARMLSAATSALSAGAGAAPPDVSDDVVITQLEQEAVEQVHKVFLPWDETRKLHFYDDKQCGMSTAIRFLRGGDNETAATEAQASLDTCKNTAGAKPAVVAHAYYNVGMTQFLLEHYDAALEALTQAVRLDGNSIMTLGMAECRRAKNLALEIAAREPAGKGTPKVDPKPGGASAQPATPKEATLEERLKRIDALHKKGVITDEEYKAKRAEILKDM